MLIFLGGMLGVPLTLAKPPADKPARARPTEAQTVTLDLVQAKLAEIQGKKSLPDDLRAQLLDLYQLAQNRLEAAQEFEANAASYQQAIASAPGETKRIQGLLTEATAETPLEAEVKAPDVPVPELERRLAQEEAHLTSLKDQLADWDQQFQEQQNRPVKAREELTGAQNDLVGIDQDLKRAPNGEASPLLVGAQRIALRAQRRARTNEIKLLEQEISSYDARMGLLNAQRELAARDLLRSEARVNALRDAITARQRSEAAEAQAQAEQAERDAMGKHPAIRRVIGENAALTKELADTVERLGKTNADRESAEAQAKQIEKDFQSAKQKFEIAGLSQALGQVLREQRRRLPDVSRYERATKKRQDEVARVGLGLLQVEEKRNVIKGPKTALRRIMTMEVDSALPPEERSTIEDEMRGLLKDQRGLLDRLSEAYGSYLRALGELDFAQRRRIDGAQGYATFLDERLLWIPSAGAVGLQTVEDLGSATAWLLSPSHWLETTQAFGWRDGREPQQLVLVGLLLVVMVLLALRRRLQARIEAISALVARPNTDRFLLTVQALSLTLLVAAPLPLLVGTLGWFLQGMPEAPADAFPRAVGDGLSHIALPWFFFSALYRLCRTDGVAEHHFHWRESALKLLRHHLSWLIPVALPSMFVTGVVGWQAEEAHRDSLGRLAFIASMIAFAVFGQRILRPNGGVLEEELRRNPHGWLSRLRYLWYPIGAGIPGALAGLAVVGYYYTARQLEAQLAATVWLVIGGVIAHDLVIRWLRLAQRELAFAKVKEKREAAGMAQAAQAAAEVSGDAAPIELELHMVDLPTINEQTRQLTRIVIGLSVIVGLWFIWVQVLPALAILDRITLWEHAVVVDGQARQHPITLANLVLAALVGVVTVTAARNLPGVLEIAVLQRLSIDAGSRYAITQVSRYVIVAAGISGAFNAIGGSWSQIQWIVAALGVGLGFGLQEIFANFVSGLIILLEQPIRVGDTVTVRDVSGTVSRIRMRTTTIIDWDRRALIVPNKTFITEQLINWSLDPTTRIVLKIGVAAGTDLALAQKLILDTAKALPQVLTEPEPTVYFIGVGDNTLNFELRVYVKELEQRMPLMHSLDIALHDAFRDQDIRIRIPPV
ncbi:MAG: mechanosensitive ion channel domain-containing protein [Gammaproteobacteria bacterium]